MKPLGEHAVENGAALAALGRLVDQAWNTAGDDAGRERVHEDRATILAVLTRPIPPGEQQPSEGGNR